MKRSCLWGYRPVDMTCFPIYSENETQRVWFRCNTDARAIRVRLSNEYNYFPLNVSHLTIGACDRVGHLTGAPRDVTLDGRRSFAIPADTSLASDEVDIHLYAGQWVAVSIHFAKRSKIVSGIINKAADIEHVACGDGDQCSAVSVSGSRLLKGTAEFTTANGTRYNLVCATVWGIDGLVDDSVREIYAFGDSITNHGFWSEALAGRLYDAFPGNVSLCNLGISGNKILNETSPMKKIANFFGERALNRFEKDVYGWGCNPTTVILQIGINDIIHNIHGVAGPDVTALEIFSGLERLASIAHSHGSKVVVCTLTPFRTYYMEKSDEEISRHNAKRIEVNRLIRSSSSFDGIVEFSSEMEDPSDTMKAKPGYCSDGLHPTESTGRILANLFDLDTLIG